MINLNDCIQIGFLSRPYGYKGQLILRLKNIGFDDIVKMEWVFVIIDGLPVPFFIEEYSDRSAESLLVKLEDVNDETIAKTYANKEIFINKTGIHLKVSNDISTQTIQGFTVIDENAGTIGKVESVIENPNNPLIQIIDEKKEVLLPLNEDFIIEIDSKSKLLHVKCPKGLIDLN